MLPKTKSLPHPVKPGAVPSTTQKGAEAENKALALLQTKGLVLLERNFKSPGRGGGEIDLIMRDPQGTLVFVEVRQRTRNDKGGAAASITAVKKKRIIFAARHYLLRLNRLPPCRFDVVLLEGPQDAPIWLEAAFDASTP